MLRVMQVSAKSSSSNKSSAALTLKPNFTFQFAQIIFQEKNMRNLLRFHLLWACSILGLY